MGLFLQNRITIIDDKVFLWDIPNTLFWYAWYTGEKKIKVTFRQEKKTEDTVTRH